MRSLLLFHVILYTHRAVGRPKAFMIGCAVKKKLTPIVLGKFYLLVFITHAICFMHDCQEQQKLQYGFTLARS